MFNTATYAAIDQPTASPAKVNPDISKVLILGDSLSAAYGLTQEEGWVSLLQNMLSQHEDSKFNKIHLINASISGETTDGGLARLSRLIKQHQPRHILIEPPECRRMA